MVCLASSFMIMDILFLLVPVAILIYGIYMLLKLIRCKYPIEAKVDEIRKIYRYRRRSEKRLAPGRFIGRPSRYRVVTTFVGKCSYIYNGCRYQSKELVLYRYYDEGEEVVIHINPKNPTEAIKKGTLIYIVTVFCISVSLGFIAASTVIKSAMSVMDYTKNQMTNSVERQKSISEFHEKTTNNDISFEDTNRPVDGSKYVKVNYHGIIKVVPKRYTEPVYPKNNKNSTWFVFKDKETGIIQCKVTVKSYKGDVEAGMNKIAENVEKNYNQSYENIYRGRESKKNIPIRIDKAYGGNGFIYFAYWIYNGQYVLIKHYTSFVDAKVMATQSTLYAD